MSTLDYIALKFGLDLNQKSPIEILKINRTIMAQTLFELNFKIGVEIGTAQGYHAETLCKNNPNLLLHCIDAWEAYGGYHDYSANTLNRFYHEATQRLKNYNCNIIRKFSMDAVGYFPDKSLDFVYVDGAHDFKSVTLDICEWSKKVRNGGILFGHDFKRSVNDFNLHVQDVVSAYAYAYKIRPWFVLGERGHHDGQYREGTRAWMWVEGESRK